MVSDGVFLLWLVFAFLYFILFDSLVVKAPSGHPSQIDFFYVCNQDHDASWPVITYRYASMHQYLVLIYRASAGLTDTEHQTTTLKQTQQPDATCTGSTIYSCLYRQNLVYYYIKTAQNKGGGSHDIITGTPII